MNTLLVIDDQPDNVKILLKFLSSRGFKVLIAENGVDGINMAELTLPDLILLDIAMPKMDGFEACQVLKNNDKTKNIPIIFMSARTDIVDKLKSFDLGAADYITKPLELEEVLARVNTQLRLHQLQLQLLEKNQMLQAEIKCRKRAEESLQTEQNALGEANAQLARVAQLKDEFLANMSHELRSPLNSILGISETFQDQIYGPLNEKQYHLMQTLEESGRYLLKLINDILDLSKIEAEKITLDINTVSVIEVCQASLRMIKGAAYKKRLRLSNTLDSTVETIQADERRLMQILVNLLSNAVKFTPEGGSIQLIVQGNREHNVVYFSVEDTGIGIAPDQMKNIFEPFVQIEGSLNREQEGTGLGLSLVYRLTKMHGGSVSIESEVGQGSCFTLSLPWQPLKPSVSRFEAEQIAPEPELKKAVFDKLHTSAVILLAEDQERSIMLLFDYLTMLGYKILIARDGVEAIEQTQANHPNLILMDIQMPVMSGLDAIREIRADPDIAEIPIIALTALAMQGDKERCLQAGANDYLSKPVNLKELLATIEAILSV
ncbi:MAG TPA: hybrid sensor histidine kinase/response regulator [Thiotrichaceae bacterium]|nr:hybrid sensor histidine kinase/response regulator [Thiotrichaceae bacterium]